MRRDEVTPLRRIVPIIQYFIIQAGAEQYGGNLISSAVLSIKPRTDECLVVTRVKFTGQAGRSLQCRAPSDRSTWTLKASNRWNNSALR
jgi:hypothetical protein